MLLLSALDADMLKSGLSGSARDISNSKLQIFPDLTMVCDKMESREKCAEALILKHNKKNNLYSSINFGEFSAKYFKNNAASNISMDQLLQSAVAELKEAEKYSGDDLREVDSLASVSAKEASVLSAQELSSRKTKKLFSRMADSEMLSLATLIELSKARIASLSIIVSQNTLGREEK